MCVFETCQALKETQTQNVADTTQRNSHSRSEKNDSLAREGYSSCHQELQGEVFPGVSDSQPLKIMKTHGFTSGVCWLGVVDRLLDSSTAQGGGGSLQNRKPIGEVGCCESRMAERIH